MSLHEQYNNLDAEYHFLNQLHSNLLDLQQEIEKAVIASEFKSDADAMLEKTAIHLASVEAAIERCDQAMYDLSAQIFEADHGIKIGDDYSFVIGDTPKKLKVTEVSIGKNFSGRLHSGRYSFYIRGIAYRKDGKLGKRYDSDILPVK